MEIIDRRDPRATAQRCHTVKAAVKRALHTVQITKPRIIMTRKRISDPAFHELIEHRRRADRKNDLERRLF